MILHKNVIYFLFLVYAHIIFMYKEWTIRICIYVGMYNQTSIICGSFSFVQLVSK